MTPTPKRAFEVGVPGDDLSILHQVPQHTIPPPLDQTIDHSQRKVHARAPQKEGTLLLKRLLSPKYICHEMWDIFEVKEKTICHVFVLLAVSTKSIIMTSGFTNPCIRAPSCRCALWWVYFVIKIKALITSYI